MNKIFLFTKHTKTSEDCDKLSKSVSYETLVGGTTTAGGDYKQIQYLSKGGTGFRFCKTMRFSYENLVDCLSQTSPVFKLVKVLSLATVLATGMLCESWADYVWDEDCGKDCSWEIIQGENGNTLKITGNGGAMKNFGADPADVYTTHLAPWNREEYNITSVIVNGFSSVGNDAFSNMSTITTASISNTTSIGDSAFSGATSLTNIDMPDLTTIGSGAFYNASSLTGVEMPNVETIGKGAFMNASSLTDVEMPNVETIGYWAFYNATSLSSVDMPNVETIGAEAFINATNLSYVGLNNNFDAEGYFLDTNNNRVVINANNKQECHDSFGKWVGEWGNGICYAGLDSDFFSKPFSNTGVSSTCGQGGSCGTCTGYLVSGRGCVTADTCENLQHYKWDSSTNSCNRIQTASNDVMPSADAHPTVASCASDGKVLQGNVCVSSCGSSFRLNDGECDRIRYTPAEAAQYLKDTDNEIIMTFKVNR